MVKTGFISYEEGKVGSIKKGVINGAYLDLGLISIYDNKVSFQAIIDLPFVQKQEVYLQPYPKILSIGVYQVTPIGSTTYNVKIQATNKNQGIYYLSYKDYLGNVHNAYFGKEVTKEWIQDFIIKEFYNNSEV